MDAYPVVTPAFQRAQSTRALLGLAAYRVLVPPVCCVGAEALGGGRTQMVAYQSNVDTVKTIQEREDAMARREKEMEEEMCVHPHPLARCPLAYARAAAIDELS